MPNKTSVGKLTQTGPGFHEVLLDNLNEAVNLIDPDLKVLYTNPVSDRLTGYPRSEVIGRPCPKNLLIGGDYNPPLPCSRACPVETTLRTGEIQDFPAYIHHKEGFLLPIQMRIIPVQDRSGDILGALEIFSETSPRLTLPQSADELSRMNMMDSLTGLGNKRFLEMYINSRLTEIKRFRVPFGILFVDVDGMQKINDSHGSVVGDKMLRMVSRTLTANIRFFEVVGRWGGEEFIVILLNLNDTKLDLVANKLRLLVEKSNIREHDKLLRATVSIGATLARSSDSIETLTARARKLADQSKRLGRNRVSTTLAQG